MTNKLNMLRRRGAEESGAVIVIVAIMLVCFLGMAALAIDVGSFYQAQTHAQAAADAGALAASQDLPSSASAATTDGQTYALKNFPGATATVSTPVGTNTNAVKVTVNATSPAFFGQLFGVTKANISASAVAAAGTSGGANAAIFADDSTCSDNSNGDVTLEQGDLTLNGGILSNGSMLASGHGNTYSSGTYGGPNHCSWTDNSGGDNQFGSSTSPTSSTADNPWPENYASDFPVYPFTLSGDPNCTFVGSDLNLQNESGQTIANGTYCYQTIEFNSANLTCKCTFVAGSFQLNQGPDTFTPFYKDLMFYDVNDTSLNVNSNGPSFFDGGTVFAPNANLTVNAPSGTISGFIEAKTVTINGGGPTTWNGSGPPVGGTAGVPSLLQ